MLNPERKLQPEDGNQYEDGDANHEGILPDGKSEEVMSEDILDYEAEMERNLPSSTAQGECDRAPLRNRLIIRQHLLAVNPHCIILSMIYGTNHSSGNASLWALYMASPEITCSNT